MEIMTDEKVLNCSKPGMLAGVIDMTDLAMITEDDEKTYMNGTVKFLVPL